jgi:uncharacterized lipoprotein YajG
MTRMLVLVLFLSGCASTKHGTEVSVQTSVTQGQPVVHGTLRLYIESR